MSEGENMTNLEKRNNINSFVSTMDIKTYQDLIDHLNKGDLPEMVDVGGVFWRDSGVGDWEDERGNMVPIIVNTLNVDYEGFKTFKNVLNTHKAHEVIGYAYGTYSNRYHAEMLCDIDAVVVKTSTKWHVLWVEWDVLTGCGTMKYSHSY